MDWYQVLTFVGCTIGACWWINRDSFKEMKDFHFRLRALEERYIQIMERILEKKQ